MKHLRLVLLATTALISLQPALANPLAPDVVAGNVSAGGLGTSQVVINQSSDKAIIDWRSFDIGVGETTTFKQPGANSVTLNRVTGGLGPSQILGALNANGQIFLINPDGILIGKNATIDVGALVATTHDLFDGDFLKGDYEFGLPGNPSASVVNLGKITVRDGGFAALVAPGVRNAGIITARLGKVSLASVSTFSLDPYGDGLIKLGLSEDTAGQVIDLATGKPLTALVSNDGSILANGGLVELNAAATRKIINSVVNNTGLIEADSVGTRNGRIILSAATASSKLTSTPSRAVTVSGTLSAAGKETGESGGTVQITGEQIALTEATIDAFGWNGGGSVLVGGDVGGGNASEAQTYGVNLADHSIATASATSVDTGTVIDASATDAGNGGKVVVWSDGETSYDGSITAKGGEGSGNGGFVETSGHDELHFAGAVDTSAVKGKAGTLLLDPLDVTIGTTGAHAITPADIEAALASNNVVVTTGSSGTEAGDVTVAEAVSWSNANSLSINATRDLTVNASISNTGGANIMLRADDQGTGIGTVSFGSGGSVSTTGDVALYFNPSVNPAGSLVNTSSYVNPTENFAAYVTAGSFTPYMLVNSVYDLQNIQNNLAGDYALGKDIDASSFAFSPFGNGTTPFSGSLSGNGSTIDQLNISIWNTPYVGLIGDLGPTGTVDGIGLTNVSVSEVNTIGGIFEGALVGYNGGHITRSFSTGSVSMVGAGYEIGGLVGQNAGTISQSYSLASVYGTGYNSVAYGDAGRLGGLVGSNFGNIDYSYAGGAVTGPVNSYSTYIGGLVGYNGGPVSYSYALGSPDTGALLPIGFDPSVWGIDESYNADYPYLLWERSGTLRPPSVVSPGDINPPPPPPPPPPPSAPNDVTGSSQVAAVADNPIATAFWSWVHDTFFAVLPKIGGIVGGAAGEAAGEAVGSADSAYSIADNIAELTIELDKMVKAFHQQNEDAFDFELQDKCGSSSCTEDQVDKAVDDLGQIPGITLNGMGDIAKTLLHDNHDLVRALFITYAREHGRTTPDITAAA